jgi:hypothetical protein
MTCPFKTLTPSHILLGATHFVRSLKLPLDAEFVCPNKGVNCIKKIKINKCFIVYLFF